MDNIFPTATPFLIKENKFTELFSILKQNKISSNGLLELAYRNEEITKMKPLVDHCIDIFLSGLQETGHLLNVLLQENPNVVNQVKDIGFFLTGTTNLIQALHDLRADLG